MSPIICHMCAPPVGIQRKVWLEGRTHVCEVIISVNAEKPGCAWSSWWAAVKVGALRARGLCHFNYQASQIVCFYVQISLLCSWHMLVSDSLEYKEFFLPLCRLETHLYQKYVN